MFYLDDEGDGRTFYMARFDVSSGGSAPEITAYDLYGYLFDEWSDGVTTAQHTKEQENEECKNKCKE